MRWRNVFIPAVSSFNVVADWCMCMPQYYVYTIKLLFVPLSLFWCFSCVLLTSCFILEVIVLVPSCGFCVLHFFFISCLLDLPSPLSVPTCHKHVVFLPFVFVRWWFLLLGVPELHAFCVLYHSVFLVCDLLMFLVFLLIIWLFKKIKLSFLFCKKTKTIPLSAFVDPTEQSVPVRCVYEWDFKGKGFIGFTIWIYCMNIIKIRL